MVLKKSMHPVIEKLFEGLFSYLDKEVSEKEAGWISLDQLGINLTIKKELLKLNVIALKKIQREISVLKPWGKIMTGGLSCLQVWP